MARRRLRRRSEKARRHASARPGEGVAEVVREAKRVERLAYTRTQAAAALGVSRSTFNRRVLPLIETVEMPWGTKLIPVDELERVVAQRRRGAQAKHRKPPHPDRKTALSPEVVGRIREEHQSGASLGEIARRLNADGVPTSQNGRQ
jgi:hypothetical protein